MVPHVVYFDILVTIQRQFINVQYRETSKVENMVRIGVSMQMYSQNSYCSPIFSMLQSKFLFRTSSTKYMLAKMWGGGGGSRGSYLARCLIVNGFLPYFLYSQNHRKCSFRVYPSLAVWTWEENSLCYQVPARPCRSDEVDLYSTCECQSYPRNL